MAEWFKALVSKTNKVNTFRGSNPLFSVFFIKFLFFSHIYDILMIIGEMAEWLKAPVLKTDEGNTSGGSNPSFSGFIISYDNIIKMLIKFFFFFTVNFFFSTNQDKNNKYTVLIIKDFFLNENSIWKIKNAYEKSANKFINIEDFYKDLELVIYIFYIMKNNNSINIINEIIGTLHIPEELNKEEIYIWKMLMKIQELCELIYTYIKINEFHEKNQDYEDNNIYYNSLILEGEYIKKMPDLNVFNKIKTNIFYKDLKKLENKYKLKNLKIYYKKTHKILKNSISPNGKFKIILYINNILPVINYNFHMFTFDNNIEANNSYKVLINNPSLDFEIFQKYLDSSNIKYTYNNVNTNNKQLPNNVNNIFINKNINEKFILDNKIIFIKSKEYMRDNVKDFQITKEEIYLIVKKKLLTYMKNYNNLLKFLEEEYNK